MRNLFLLFFSLLSLFWKNKVILWDNVVCVCVRLCIPPPPINLRMPELIFMKLGVYIMESEPI
jgi:hypothetical protein